MEFDCPMIEELATPEYVLEVLADIYRHEAPYLPPLSFDTTVDDWDLVMDFTEFGSWRDVARGMNAYWSIDCPLDEWRAVLLPMKERQMRDVCNLIARHTKRPRLLPLWWLGRECWPASAFLAIRLLLRRAGCDVSSLKPSTRLTDFAGQYGMRLRGEIIRLAPRMLWRLPVSTPASGPAMCCALVGAVVAVLCAGLSSTWIGTLVGATIAITAIAYLFLAVVGVNPMKVNFGALRTFRDLAVAIAEEQRSTSR